MTQPAFQRLIALTAVYVLALQALFGAGAQLRVLLSETPGLCTILGFQTPDQPMHAADTCAVHCIGKANQDSAALTAIAVLVIALTGWILTNTQGVRFAVRPARAFQGRGPPR